MYDGFMVIHDYSQKPSELVCRAKNKAQKPGQHHAENKRKEADPKHRNESTLKESSAKKQRHAKE